MSCLIDLSFKQLVDWMIAQSKISCHSLPLSLSHSDSQLKRIDSDGDGMIDKSELLTALGKLTHPFLARALID